MLNFKVGLGVEADTEEPAFELALELFLVRRNRRTTAKLVDVLGNDSTFVREIEPA